MRKMTKEELMKLGKENGYDFKNAIYYDGALWKPYLNDEIDYTYMVSTDGRVYNIDMCNYLDPAPQIVTGNSMGRRLTMLRTITGGQKSVYIYRMVAETFIPNPDNLETVNHKDEVSYHDYITNLEWMSMKDNANYGSRNKRIVATRRLRQNLNTLFTDGEKEMSDIASNKSIK